MIARRYFEATKHPHRSRYPAMDWGNRPRPFKVYRGLERVAPDRGLARLLSLGAGVLHDRSWPQDDVWFRTYASAGALYPVEVYVVSNDPSGVYHYDPAESVLVRLREGDHRPALVRATASEPAIAEAPSVLVLTGIPWRTAWKYTERGYRHLFWDAGMMVENVLAIEAASDLHARVVTGFVDAEIEALLGLDGRTEFPLALVALGSGSTVEPAGEPPEPLEFETEPVSRRVLEVVEITEVNDAGRLARPEDVAAWRSPSAPLVRRFTPHGGDDVETAIRRRGSARRFGPRPLPVSILRDVLRLATLPVPADVGVDIEPFVIANNVNGLDRGAYVWRNGELAQIRAGDFRLEAGFLCLQQRLGSDSGATMFLMADLDRVLDAYGDRGYRAAELSAGIVGGRIYLAAYAHRFGATGLTFFDDPVTEFFEPAAAGRSCLLVVAVGDSPRLRR